MSSQAGRTDERQLRVAVADLLDEASVLIYRMQAIIAARELSIEHGTNMKGRPVELLLPELVSRSLEHIAPIERSRAIVVVDSKARHSDLSRPA